jgi:hypothetical protein
MVRMYSGAKACKRLKATLLACSYPVIQRTHERSPWPITAVDARMVHQETLV